MLDFRSLVFHFLHDGGGGERLLSDVAGGFDDLAVGNHVPEKDKLVYQNIAKKIYEARNELAWIKFK